MHVVSRAVSLSIFLTFLALTWQEGWIFDIELITLALMAGIPTAEVPITWNEVEGSKMQLMKDSIQMAIDLLIIRANYGLGRWQKPPRIKR
jgi:dolichyl-phosphate beta-glucosyltransferase